MLKFYFMRRLKLRQKLSRSRFLIVLVPTTWSCDGKLTSCSNAYAKAGGFLEQSPASGTHDFNLLHEETITRAPGGDTKNFSIDNLPCQFGDYELLEKIAHGGMGVVFRARQMSLKRNVAIKMILSGQFAGPQEIKRFHVEAEAAGDLDHPGIVPIFDVGCHQDRHYFSMAFVEGESLAARIKRQPFTPREAARMVCKICDAIQAAHDKGIVHRDLKPGNVLLDSHGEPRITDFGLAKRVEEGSELTRTGMVLGTPSYMPPEQASGNEIDSSADIYSLGAILYAMVTGTAPFSGNSQLETIMMVLEDEPTSLRQHSKTVPKYLDAICLKCLEKKPRERYGSASELASDLNHFLAGEPIEAKKGWLQRFRKWTIREPALAAHISATLVLLPLLFGQLLVLWPSRSWDGIQPIGLGFEPHHFGQLGICSFCASKNAERPQNEIVYPDHLVSLQSSFSDHCIGSQ